MTQPQAEAPRRLVAELNAWANQNREVALEPGLPIIDAHHHLYDDKHRGRYLTDELAEDVKGSGHNVVATVFMEAGSMYRVDGLAAMQPVGEVEFANGIAAMSASGRYGAPRLCAGIVGNAELMLGEKVQAVLEALIAAGNGRLRGIRYGTTWDGTDSAARYGRRATPRHQLLEPVLRRGLARVHALGLSFDAWMFYPQLPELIELLRVSPELNVILNHAGGLLRMPPPGGNAGHEEFATWRSHVRELAQFPNLSLKVGGFGMPNCGWSFHLRRVPPSSEELAEAWRPYVETCVEVFGASRCMMESNFPPDQQTCGYGVLWNAMKRITHGYSAAEKAALYRDTAARVYRLAV
jgi:predicted TIM-barrel fold metal-dependent hydrolase